jgi:outer membrane protein OmpA-like peptidoglycan-associated protein
MSRLALVILTLLALAPRAEAQLLRDIKESAKQKLAERRERTKAHAVERATEPVDSALERGIRPVDSLVSKAATGAGAAVSRIGRGQDAARAEEEQRLVEALAMEGRAEVPGLTFSEEAETLDPSADPFITALANVLATEESVFLIVGRAGREEAGGRALGERRAAAVKAALVEAGIPAVRLFGVGRPEPGATLITVVRMQ